MVDRRAHFANERVAHVSMIEQVDVTNFSEGVRKRVGVPVANFYRTPLRGSLERQSLMGQSITVLEEIDGFSFVRAENMGFVGYMLSADLKAWCAPTHRVCASRSLLFDAPNFKQPNPETISLGSLLTITQTEGRFARLDDGRWAIAAHLRPCGQENDPVAVAERLLGTPYLWGGNSGIGIDCSGLVHAGLSACGLSCPGDSDQQEAQLGVSLNSQDAKRGDLLFWKGHVAMAVDDTQLLHANAYHMAVAYEPIREAITRIADQGDGPVTRHARLDLADLKSPISTS